MSQLIDWEYYDSHFPAIVPEAKFYPIEAQAEIELYKVVKPYMDIPLERKQDCVFQLCNLMYSNMDVLSGKNPVASVSNNGYSESYTAQDITQLREKMKELIYECIGTRLAGAFQ